MPNMPEPNTRMSTAIVAIGSIASIQIPDEMGIYKIIAIGIIGIVTVTLRFVEKWRGNEGSES